MHYSLCLGTETISYTLVVVMSCPVAVGLTGCPARPRGGEAGSGTGLSWREVEWLILGEDLYNLPLLFWKGSNPRNGEEDTGSFTRLIRRIDQPARIGPSLV